MIRLGLGLDIPHYTPIAHTYVAMNTLYPSGTRAWPIGCLPAVGMHAGNEPQKGSSQK